MFESALQQLQVQFYDRLRNSAWSWKRHVTGWCILRCRALSNHGGVRLWLTASKRSLNHHGSSGTDVLSSTGTAFAGRSSPLLKESGEGTGLPDSMSSREIMCSMWTMRLLFPGNLTMYVSGPSILVTVPGIHFPLPPLMFLILTGWYMSNCERCPGREPSWCCFSFCYLLWILSCKLGFSRVNLVRGALIRNGSAGVRPAMPCGVYLYWNRMSETQRCRGIRVSAFASMFLNVCTFLYAKPFDLGWYGGHNTCFIPFNFKNVSNSSNVNRAPLSETSDSGNPYATNSFRSSVIVLPAVVQFIMRTSIHFESLSATTKNIFLFFSGKSTCIHCHGHGLTGAAGGAFLCRETSGNETSGNGFHPHNSWIHCVQLMK